MVEGPIDREVIISSKAMSDVERLISLLQRLLGDWMEPPLFMNHLVQEGFVIMRELDVTNMVESMNTLSALMRLHAPEEDSESVPWCRECGQVFPCDTQRLLMATPIQSPLEDN